MLCVSVLMQRWAQGTTARPQLTFEVGLHPSERARRRNNGNGNDNDTSWACVLT